MAGIKVSMSSKGDFKKTLGFLDKMRDRVFLKKLPKYGERGVVALREATPKRTGKTAESWHYEIKQDEKTGRTTLYWYNDNVVKDYFNVAIMIQYGHATKSGGWVQGIDYINPALKPIFDDIVKNIEVDIQKS